MELRIPSYPKASDPKIPAVAAFALGAAALLSLALTLLLPASPSLAASARPLQLGIDDQKLLVSPENSDAERDFWFDRARSAGMDLVRIDLQWRYALVDDTIAPADPTNPADPNYDFSAYDAAVRRAHARGMDVLLTIWNAPRYAEGPNRPPVDCSTDQLPPACADPGTWKPDPQAFADFGAAVASRYSGTFAPAGADSPMPKVTHFEAWNEPNLSKFLNPQVDDSLTSISADHYRSMLNAFYDSVHAARPDALVLAPGTAPVSPGDSDFWAHYTTAPLDFLSGLFCTRANGTYLAPCPAKPKLDLLAHNPIPPRFDADVTAPPGWSNGLIPSNFAKGVSLLRKAEAKGRILPTGSPPRDVWATEIWVGSNPPDPRAVSPAKQAWNIQTTVRLLSQAGANAIVYFKLRDQDPLDGFPCHFNECGVGLYGKTADWPLTQADEPPKPALTAFTFPFTVERSSKSKASAWLRPPAKGNAILEQLIKGKWTQLAKVPARRGVPLTAKLSLTGKAKLRARVGARTSLTLSLPAS